MRIPRLFRDEALYGAPAGRTIACQTLYSFHFAVSSSPLMVDAARCFDMIRLCHRSDPFFGPADYVDLAIATNDEYTRWNSGFPLGR